MTSIVIAMAVDDDNNTELIVESISCSKGTTVSDILINQYINIVTGMSREHKTINAQNRKLGILQLPNSVTFCLLAEPVDVLK